jgi:hypothetical protein
MQSNQEQTDSFVECIEVMRGLKLEPMIFTTEDRVQVLQLLYKYRHLNGGDLTNLSCTDLITHRVRIKPRTKPANNSIQKRCPTHTKWWLRKIVKNDEGIYELVKNELDGRFSQRNARAVIVDKVENLKSEDEPRVTFA